MAKCCSSKSKLWPCISAGPKLTSRWSHSFSFAVDPRNNHPHNHLVLTKIGIREKQCLGTSIIPQRWLQRNNCVTACGILSSVSSTAFGGQLISVRDAAHVLPGGWTSPVSWMPMPMARCAAAICLRRSSHLRATDACEICCRERSMRSSVSARQRKYRRSLRP